MKVMQVLAAAEEVTKAKEWLSHFGGVATLEEKTSQCMRKMLHMLWNDLKF